MAEPIEMPFGNDLSRPKDYACIRWVKVKKVKVRFLYSATYTANNHNQPRFTILEVSVDWQEPMVLQRKLRPSIARVNGQLDTRHAADKHHRSNQPRQAFIP